jgi:hypothetical protein
MANRKFSHEYCNARAIEIYKWILTQERGFFRTADIPGYERTVRERAALQMLVDRQLIAVRSNGSKKQYKLFRIVEPSDCLKLPPDSDIDLGVKRYRVPLHMVGRAASMDNLNQYSIR